MPFHYSTFVNELSLFLSHCSYFAQLCKGFPKPIHQVNYILNPMAHQHSYLTRHFFCLPDEGYYATVDISVKSVKFCVLELGPDYKDKMSIKHIMTIFKGVEAVELRRRLICVVE
jgi:hypothetical protein